MADAEQDSGNILVELFEAKLNMGVFVSLLMFTVPFIRYACMRMYPVYPYIIILFSYIAGIIVRNDDLAGLYDQSVDVVPSMTMELCLPIFLFYSSIGTDFSELSLNAGTVILYLVSFTMAVTLAGSFIVWPLLHFTSNITFTATFFLMTMLAPKWVRFPVTELDHVQGHVRDVQMMLKFEQLCSTWVGYFMVEFVFKLQLFLSWPEFIWYKHVLLMLLCKFAGILIGAVFAVLIRFPFSFAYDDVPSQAIIIISSLFLVQMVCRFLGASFGLAVGIFGMLLNSNKIKMSKAAEEFHELLWEWYIFVATTIVAIAAGFILGLKRPAVLQIYHYGNIVFIYCVLLALRFIGLILTFHWASKQKDIYWKRAGIVLMGPYHGIPCIALATHHLVFDEMTSYQNITYIVGVCAFSSFFNGMLFKRVLQILGMFEYKRATIVNMNIAVGQINTCRDRAIFSQKTDQVISDANWAIVENLTRLPHPYRRRLMESGYSDDKGDFRLRTIICPKCGMEVVAPPTKGEIDDMISEGKQRVLKIQLVSFGQQYENGTITRHTYRTLFSVIDTAANSGNPIIDSASLNIQTQESKCTRFFRSLFTYLTAVTNRSYPNVPVNIFRLMAFRLATSRIFNIIMAALSLCDMGIIACLIYIWARAENKGFRNFSDTDLEWGRIFQIFDIVFFFLFLAEQTIFFLGIGLLQYFSSHLNKIEFGSNIIRAAQLYMYFNAVVFRRGFKSVLLMDDIVMLMKILLLVRFVRIYVFVIGWLPKFLALIEKQVEDELMKNYEVGKGYLVSLERVMKFLSHIAIYDSVYEALKHNIDNERRKVAKDLGSIQKENPSIAITVKTKHAIRFVINVVADCINDLKEDGILDLNENKAINNSLDRVRDTLRELGMVDPSLAQGVLKEVIWLNQNEVHSEIVRESARLTSYDYNDTLINVGDDPTGLYVLVSGLVKAYYNPTPKTVHLNSKFGVLPNFDFFEVLKFDQAQDTYVVAGNVIGEIGAVTGRRYDMTVVCETSVQLYYIEWSVIRAIVHESEGAILVQGSIWKCIGIRLAMIILQSKPPYSDWTKEKLLAFLDNGWVPSLVDKKSVVITDDVAESILIEGVCRDAASGRIFHGPTHILKGTKLLHLPEHPKWNFQTVYTTRILIVPVTAELTQIITSQMFTDHYNLDLTIDTSSKERKVGFGGEQEVVSRSQEFRDLRESLLLYEDSSTEFQGPENEKKEL